MQGLLVVLAALVGASQAFLFGNNQYWSGLKGPWNLNPLSHGFSSIPRDKNHDIRNGDGWTLQKNWCAVPGGAFVGYRWWNKNNPTVMVLFDVNGYVAGLQNAIPTSVYTPSSNMMNHPSVKDTINGRDYWVLTVYFVDPKIVCNPGRSSSDYKKWGTGNQFNIQNGTTPASLISIPLKESTLKAQNPMWVGPKCFYTMGNHYWYNINTQMPCSQFFPFCLLYNSGKLDAFCFGVNGSLNNKDEDSPHPTYNVLSKFFKAGHAPKCFAQNPAFQSLSTMHIYMTDSPRTTFC